MKARDVMTKQVYTVRPSDSAKKAADLICRHQIAGLPVIDENNKVVGVVSEKDILKKIYPSYDEFHRDPIGSMNFEEMEKNFQDVNGLKVKDIMATPPITAPPDMPILKIGSMMILKRIRRVPIVDGQGKLLGIVSQGDIHRSACYSYLPAEYLLKV
jgi:CBS domain-containing protein